MTPQCFSKDLSFTKKSTHRHSLSHTNLKVRDTTQEARWQPLTFLSAQNASLCTNILIFQRDGLCVCITPSPHGSRRAWSSKRCPVCWYFARICLSLIIHEWELTCLREVLTISNLALMVVHGPGSRPLRPESTSIWTVWDHWSLECFFPVPFLSFHWNVVQVSLETGGALSEHNKTTLGILFFLFC